MPSPGRSCMPLFLQLRPVPLPWPGHMCLLFPLPSTGYGPLTVNTNSLDSIRPSSVQIAPCSSQSSGDRQDDRDSAVGVGPDRDPPEDVARLVQPLRLLHRSAAHREGVVPQGPVAYPGLLSEPQLEGERVLAVVGCRNVLHADREQADADLVRIHVPGFDDAVEAGKALTNFGDLWQSASVGQRNRMLQAIYVDLDKREIVGLLPKKNFLGPILSMAERADVTLQGWSGG